MRVLLVLFAIGCGSGGSQRAFSIDIQAGGHPVPNLSVSWAAAPASIATIAQDGVATGVSVGTATITATSAGKSASASLTVASSGPAPASVTVSAGGASTSLTSIGDSV